MDLHCMIEMIAHMSLSFLFGCTAISWVHALLRIPWVHALLSLVFCVCALLWGSTLTFQIMYTFSLPRFALKVTEQCNLCPIARYQSWTCSQVWAAARHKCNFFSDGWQWAATSECYWPGEWRSRECEPAVIHCTCKIVEWRLASSFSCEHYGSRAHI